MFEFLKTSASANLGDHLLGWRPSNKKQKKELASWYMNSDAAIEKKLLQTRQWVMKSKRLDQKSTPHCVGGAFAHFGNCLPIDDHYKNSHLHRIYKLAKELEGEPNEENGTTLYWGAQAMIKLGRIRRVGWINSLDEMKTWLSQRGPVPVGTYWYQDMFTPNADGYVFPTGEKRGGHAYLCSGINMETETFNFDQSWGSGWGLKGTFKMRFKDFKDLLYDNGEACAAVELPLGKFKK